MPDLTLERWSQLTAAEQTALAQRLLRRLPPDFQWVGLRTHTQGAAQHTAAVFSWRRAEFVLIPEVHASVGLDPHHWQPSPAELESFAFSAEEYELDGTLQEYVAQATLRPRDVHCGPMLVEIAAQPPGWRPLDPDDATLHAKAALYALGLDPGRSITLFEDPLLRVRKLADGQHQAERAPAHLTHQMVTAALATEGFRLPTSDEWSLLCGAGAPTLFRWGDHAPCDRYPTDDQPTERAYQHQKERAATWPEGAWPHFARDWRPHQQPNLFGLQIAQNPYKQELVDEPDQLRGGDGGVATCGGAGFFLAG